MIVIAFLCIIFYNVRFAGKDVFFDNSLSFTQTSALRGICAIEIVLGHLGAALPKSYLLYPFQKAGILVVGIFFFLSGYGLIYNYLNKQAYLEGFLKKRLSALLLPVIIVWIIKSIVNFSMNPKSNIFVYMAQKNIFRTTNWFVWELLLCYLIFYFAYKHFSIMYAVYLNIIFAFVFILICYFTRMTDPWYGSTLCFPMGIIVGINYDKIIYWMRKRIFYKAIYFTFLLAITSVLFILLPEGKFVTVVVTRNIASITFVLLVLLLLQKVKIGNKISLFLGKISYEIYLIHFSVINWLAPLKKHEGSELLYVTAVFVISIFLGWMFHCMIAKFIKIFRNAVRI